MSVDIVFSFDTTGSMYPAIAEVRRQVADTVKTLFQSIPNLRIGILAHGDYNDLYEIQEVQLTTDQSKLIRFVSTVGSTSGFGNGGEAYELVMHHVQSYQWRDDATKVFVMIGDEPAHYRGKNVRGTIVAYDWKTEAFKIRGMDISQYVVRCLNRSDSLEFHTELSRIQGTPLLHLHQFNNITELVMALTFRAHSVEAVTSYGASLEASGKLNRNLAAILGSLTGNNSYTTSVKNTPNGLVPVDPTRFQVLHVDTTIDIKSFVQSTGATFRIGRGFYELTKREEIQPNKEIVLWDKTTGDMFTGDEARNLLHLPYGERGNRSPYDVPYNYVAFVQSTSNNRKLMPNTRFLYENEGI